MKTAATKEGVRAPFEESDLLDLELRVAKRADRLWRKAGYRRGMDLVHWMQAERDVLGSLLALKRPVEALLAAD
jgi:hypothetical protein